MTLFDLLTASKAAAKAGDLERARHLADRMTPFTDDEWLAFDAWAKELDGLGASQCNAPADPRDYIGAPRQALSFEYAIAGSYDEARRMLDAKKEAKRAAAEKANPAKRRPKGRVERAGSGAPRSQLPPASAAESTPYEKKPTDESGFGCAICPDMNSNDIGATIIMRYQFIGPRRSRKPADPNVPYMRGQPRWARLIEPLDEIVKGTREQPPGWMVDAVPIAPGEGRAYEVQEFVGLTRTISGLRRWRVMWITSGAAWIVTTDTSTPSETPDCDGVGSIVSRPGDRAAPPPPLEQLEETLGLDPWGVALVVSGVETGRQGEAISDAEMKRRFEQARQALWKKVEDQGILPHPSRAKP